MRVAQESGIYDMFDVVRDDVMLEDGSLFTDRPIWTVANATALYEAFIGNPDVSSRSFIDKFERQLSEVGDDVVQLAAECLAVYYLPCVTGAMGAATKQQRVEQVLSWMSNSVAVPDAWHAVFEHGLWHPGTHYISGINAQLAYLFEFLVDLKADGTDRERVVGDPWELKEFAWSLELHSGFTMRQTVLHMFHPDTFEPIVVGSAKTRIVERFAEFAGGEQDHDRALLNIREALTPQFGEGFNFYASGVKERWQPDTTPWGQMIGWAARFVEAPSFDSDERDYKLAAMEAKDEVAAALEDGDSWREAFEDLVRTKQGNLLSWRVAGEVARWIRDGGSAVETWLRAVWDESSSLPDRIAAFERLWPDELDTGPGGRASVLSLLLLSEDRPPFRSMVLWEAFKKVEFGMPSSTDPEVAYPHALDFFERFTEEADARGITLRDRLDAQGAMWAALRADPPEFMGAKDRKQLLAWRGDVPDEDAEDETPPGDEASAERPRTGRADSVGALSEELHLGPTFLPEVVELLEEKGQVILSGPPGTGKTFVAKKLAAVLAEHGDRFRLVQFHSSYSYEDFVQGYRPTDSGGFELRDGPLIELAERAKEHPGELHVLVIDELNRGNVASVLGELYFLLEYRDETIRLQYANKPFKLPENLWIIGTMNTADQSIALLDSALRRRFFFVTMAPHRSPVSDLLRAALTDGQPSFLWVADVVDRANELLDDPESAIGPSHFLRKSGLTEAWVERIWEHSVLPHVADRLFETPGKLSQFTLSSLRADVTREPLSATTRHDADGADEVARAADSEGGYEA